jgi:two-component system OmpR family response regulator
MALQQHSTVTPDMRILVIEDDADTAAYMVKGLKESGYVVDHAADGKDGMFHAMSGNYDALIVDRMLPNVDGLSIIQAIRAAGIKTPALILSALGAVDDRVKGLKAGGDDYLTKPFDLDELIARLRALLRRAVAEPGVTLGELTLDPAAHAVSAGDETVALTPTEFRLLAKLASHVDAVVRRHELLLAAWPAGAVVHDNTLDVYIARLRRKLKSLPGAPQIETAHGVGYSIRS